MVGRRIDRPRPVRLGRVYALRAAIVEDRVAESAGPHRGVEIGDGLVERRRVEIEHRGALRDRARGDRRVHRWHELAHRLGIDDRERELVRLACDQPPPEGVALRPEILHLVGKSLRVLVDHDAERHRVHSRHDASVELRRARVDRDAVALRGIADRFRSLLEQQLQHASRVVRRATHEEIVGWRAPSLAQPREVRLEAPEAATIALARIS